MHSSPTHPSRSALPRVAAFAVLFLAALGLTLVPDAFDRPLTRLLNARAGLSETFDGVMSLLTLSSASTVLLVSFAWACWSASPEREHRARVVVALVVAFGAGVVSRMLQYTLPTHPRPALDPDIVFRVPFHVQPVLLNTWNAFPSDHATVLTGLVLVNFVTRGPWRWAAVAVLAFTQVARVYTGAHYPSDILGGAGLAGILVWSTQVRPFLRIGGAVAALEQRSAPIFYFSAFFLTYQIATLFFEFRSAASLLLRLQHPL